MKKGYKILIWAIVLIAIFIAFWRFADDVATEETVVDDTSVSMESLGSMTKEVDLNGDGQAEKIAVSFFGNNPDSFSSARLTINDQTTDITEENIHKDFTIVDIDTADTYKEIAISADGPSSDYSTTFFAYDGQRLFKVGRVSGILSEIKFNQQGGLSTITRANILDTWFFRDDYKLSSGHTLANVPKSFYDREHYKGEMQVSILKDISMQKSPTDSTLAFRLKKGDKITMLGCDNVKWCALSNAKGAKGWFELVDYNQMAIGGFSDEYFLGLSNAD